MKKYLFVMFILAFALSVFGQKVTGLAGWNIVLDPGHSFKENMGVSGFSEAEKNVRVAWALRDLLMQNTDIDTVYLTRKDDNTNVSLSSRSQYANSIGAAWFHSIHSDATGSGGPSETNAALLLWGQLANSSERPPAGGKGMSDIMIDQLSRGMRIMSSGSRGDCYFYNTGWCPYLSVTRNTLMPAELSEAGHHTNPAQNQRQMSLAFNKLEAYTLYWSILKYHHIPLPVDPVLTGLVTDLERKVPINGAIIQTAGKSCTTDSYESVFNKYTADPEALRNGFYLVDGLPSGSLEIVSSAPEYYADTLQVAASDSFFTFADIKLVWKRPPAVTLSSPAEGYDRQPAWGSLVFTFNRPVDRASLQSAFRIAPSAGGTFSWADNDQRMYFKPDTLLYETEYVVTIAATAKDRYGHLLDGNGDRVGGDDYTLKFRTGPQDMAPPRISTVYPPSNSTAIDTRPVLNITYDEIIDSSSVQPNLFTLQKTGTPVTVPVTHSHHIVRDKSILSVAPLSDLEPGQLYSLVIAPGLRDLLGNEESATKTYRVKAGSAYWRTQSIDSFDSGIANWWAPVTSGTTTGILADSTRSFAASDAVNPLTASTLALGIDYGWNITSSTWILREYLNGGAPKSVTFDKSKRLQVYLFGDNSGTLFRFAVDDRVPVAAAANHEVSPWYKVDWYGWRLISWEMNSEPAGVWLGDGQLDGTLAFDSIQLGYEPGGYTSGTLYFDDLRVAEYSAVSVETSATEAPQRFSLQQNFPNPFNPSTTITYNLPEGMHMVELRIYDLLGRTIRTLVDGQQPAGHHIVLWDGRDDGGQPAPSGIYLYQIKTPFFTSSRRMAYIK
jgi:N-acetylmuramoyl-L-alanine amidase